MNQQSNPTVIVSNIPNSLHNLYIRLWTYFIILPDGKGYYFVNGKRIAQKEFEDNYPIGLENLID